MKIKKKVHLLLEKETIKAFRNSIARLRMFAFVSNMEFSELNSKIFTISSSEKLFKDWFIVYISFKRPNLRSVYSLQRNR